MEAKLGLYDVYYNILGTGVVPQSWYRTTVVPIVKPCKDSLLSGSYRPRKLLLVAGSSWKNDLYTWGYCLLLNMILEKEEVREIFRPC
jgi:hypothetical protein